MGDPAKTTEAQVRYEVRLQPGPWKFEIRGVEHEIKERDDACVLVRIITQGGVKIADEKIVGVIGGDRGSSIPEMLRLLAFLNAGGVIGLHRDLIS